MKLKRSPLAPAAFPALPDIKGVTYAVGSMGMYGERNDVFVARFDKPAAAAGVFTRSLTRSADVDWCRTALENSEGRARVLVVNAGNSNAFTGAAGLAKNKATVEAATQLSGCSENEVYLAATGVIGQPIKPLSRVADKMKDIWPTLGEARIEDAAKAFMTTDTFAKGSCASAEIDGDIIQIAGITKGSGMIAPNMATMLAYVFTDAAITPEVLQSLVSKHVETTFNSITVDSDTSTSDTLMVFATGATGPLIETVSDPRLEGFSLALKAVLKDLALQIVRDGEGASKLIEVTVIGAQTEIVAKTIAASVANSPLVKTALAASDANWGRIVMAAGKAGVPVDRDQLSIRFGDVDVARDGEVVPDYSEEAASAECAKEEIRIEIGVGQGLGRATVWTCDLTHGYVEINGAYRS